MFIKLFIISITLFTSLVQAEQFQAPVTDTRWQVIESPLECTLSQEIKGYGDAKFTQKSQGELQLIFTSKSYPSTPAALPGEHSTESVLRLAYPAEHAVPHKPRGHR